MTRASGARPATSGAEPLRTVREHAPALARSRSAGAGRLDVPELLASASAVRVSTESIARVALERIAFSRAIELLSEGLAIFDANANLLHGNSAFYRVIEEENDRGALLLRIQTIVRDAVRQRSRGTIEQEIHAERGRYLMRLEGIRCDLMPEMLIVVALERACDGAATAEELRRLFSLTTRESEIALLLSVGRSNAEISDGLVISPHTARHHTERVLMKLGVRSRAEVAAWIRHSGRPPAESLTSRPGGTQSAPRRRKVPPAVRSVARV